MPSRRTFGATVIERRLPARFGQPERRKQAMSMTRKFSLGLLGACVAVMLASPQAGTQTAQQGEARDAAIRRCIAQANRQVPGGESQDMQRADVYKACMVNAGFQP
jgi:hypothetical protein